MNSRDFAFWLQGFFEVATLGIGPYPAKLTLTTAQIDCIQKHLDLVFAHDIDPSMGDANHQKLLNETHGGKQLRC